MSKNAEIIAEIISEEVNKFEKLVTRQSEQTKELAFEIAKAENITIKTDHLEHVIASWNLIFENQRQQILKFQNSNSKNLIFYQIAICGLTAAVFFLLISKLK
jgi:hypothetical protein